jgi:hypothetical protein
MLEAAMLVVSAMLTLAAMLVAQLAATRRELRARPAVAVGEGGGLEGEGCLCRQPLR